MLKEHRDTFREWEAKSLSEAQSWGREAQGSLHLGPAGCCALCPKISVVRVVTATSVYMNKVGIISHDWVALSYLSPSPFEEADTHPSAGLGSWSFIAKPGSVWDDCEQCFQIFYSTYLLIWSLGHHYGNSYIYINCFIFFLFRTTRTQTRGHVDNSTKSGQKSSVLGLRASFLQQGQRFLLEWRGLITKNVA